MGRVIRIVSISLVALLLSAGITAGRPPAASAQAPYSVFGFLTPAEVVTAYYAALNAREFTAAYSMLSPEAQADQPFDAWVAGYQTTQRIDVQTFAGDSPDSVSMELWVSDGTLPRVHGYNGTWRLVRDADDQFWQLDQAQIAEEAPPDFPFVDRPSVHCAPLDPAPGGSVRCAYRLERSIPRGATVRVTSVGPLPLGGPISVDCADATGGLTCLPFDPAVGPFSVELACSPVPPGDVCVGNAAFAVTAISLNGGPFSQAVTISTLSDGSEPTYFAVPDPPVTFTSLVPPAPPTPNASE
jgi:hypothetical protein